MEAAFQLRSLYPHVDLALVNKNQLDIPKELKDKAFGCDANPREIVSRLQTARILYIHPDGFDTWTDILFFLTQKMTFPVKLIIIAGSDYAVGDEHMEPFLAFFPNTTFWIWNWCGSLERCHLLPLGVNGQAIQILTKYKPLGISFLLKYIGNEKREEFYNFIDAHPEIHQYCLKRGTFQEYCSALSECYFSTCPMGEGFDTYRFWESLMVGAIPIVKDHPFYETLHEQYPSIPMIRIQSWDDLPSILPQLTKEKWEGLHTLHAATTQAYWDQELEKISEL